METDSGIYTFIKMFQSFFISSHVVEVELMKKYCDDNFARSSIQWARTHKLMLTCLIA